MSRPAALDTDMRNHWTDKRAVVTAYVEYYRLLLRDALRRDLETWMNEKRFTEDDGSGEVDTDESRQAGG
jgi:hypothetical protein